MTPNIRNLILYAVTIFGLGIAFTAKAEPDRILLASPDAIEEACKGQIHAVHIICEHIRADDVDNAAAGSLLWVPRSDGDFTVAFDVPPNRMSWLDRHSDVEYFVQAMIYTRADPAGQKYQMARIAVIKRVSHDLRSVGDLDDVAWDKLTAIIPAAEPGAPAAATFLASQDQRAATLAAQEADRAADAQRKVDTQNAYLASPEYKRDKIRTQVVACRQAISRAHATIAQDKRVAEISGYENKLLREQAAVTIVGCQDVIAQSGG